MNLFGKWTPLVQAAGALVGIVFFAQSARRLWNTRRNQRRLARRPKKPDGKR